jgi:ribose transport system ATP-binding protein
MVGKESNSEYYHINSQVEPEQTVVLSVDDLGLYGRFKHVSFDLRKGEVLGICGVVGSGKEDICACVCGDMKPTSGRMIFEGREMFFDSPSKALDNGVISVPKWRNEEGVLGSLSIAENIPLSNLGNVTRGVFINAARQIGLAGEWIDKLNIKCQGAREEVRQLSGGNTQKVVFARVLSSGAKILVLNHPTRGVDIGAKEEIYSLIRDITKTGISVILLSDTLEECIGLANNILVMRDGYISRSINAPAGDKPGQAEIVRYMV